MEKKEMGVEEILKIDRSMGERRSHQIIGVVLIVGLVFFAIYWDKIRVIFGWKGHGWYRADVSPCRYQQS